MSISDIAARLTLNARQFTAQFDTAIGQATARARQGGRVIGESFSGAARGGLEELAGRIPVVGSAIGGLGGAALGATAAIGGLTAVLAVGIGEAEKYAQQAGKLDAVLKATGNNTGFAAQELRALGDELQTITAIDAEDFLAAQRQLATFGGVAGSVFKDAITLAADLSATFGGDVVSNTEKLGLALQGLAENNAQPLARAFKFLGTETLGTITALSEQGKAFEAQQALVDALRKRVGGTAAAAGDDLTGDMYRLRDAFDATAQSIAEGTGAYDGLRRGVQGLTSDIEQYFNVIKNAPKGEALNRVLLLQASNVLDGNPFSGVFGNPLAQQRQTITRPARAPFSIADGSQQFGRVGALNFEAIGQRAEENIARAATEAAAAEARKTAAAQATAAALEKQRIAGEAAARAAAAQATALRGQLADLRFQNALIGRNADEAARTTELRKLEQQFGAQFTDALRQQFEQELLIRDVRRQIVQLREDELRVIRAQIDAGFGSSADAARGRSMGGMDAALRRATAGVAPPSAEDPEVRRQFEFTSNAFFEILSRGQGSFWASFEQAGFRAVANIAAQLAQNSGISSLFGGAVGQLAGGFSAGIGIGSLFGTSTGNRIGGGLGGVAGSLIGGPVGSLIGGALGSLVGGAFSRDPFADAFLTTQGGQVTTSRIAARGDGRQEQAAGLAGSVAQGLAQLAGALGGSVANGINLGAIGSNRGTFYFNPTGGDFRSAGVQQFATPEQAVEAALRNAVARGALAGVDGTVARLLSQGDLQQQLGKATALANALRSFGETADPFGAQVRTLTDEFTQLRDIMIEAGSSSADLAKASAEYDRRLQQIRDSAGQATTTLRAFLEGLGFGSASPLALGDQRSNAQAAFQAQAARIGSASFDQNAFTQAGQRLLDIEGQLFGRTDSFFATFNQVQADTRRAIDAIDRAAMINAENPFARATAAATQATAENTATMAETMALLPQQISQQIAQALAELGLAGGDGRGFVAVR